MSRIAVVGAGMAGLSATYSLAKAGIPVTLIEADHVPGGRLATREELSLEHQGHTFTFPIEHGIHGVWRPYYNLRRLLQELGTFSTLTPAPYQELVAEQRGQRVFPEVGARLRQHPLPSLLAPAALLQEPVIVRDLLDAGLRSCLRAAKNMNHVLAFDPEYDIERYDDLPVQKLIEGWPPLVKRLFESLTHQGFFQDADRVSLAAFLTGLTFYVINDKEDTAFDVFGVDPNRALAQPIFDKLHSVGGTHLLGSPVTALSHNNERLTKLCIQNNGEEQWLEFDAVILAMDPANLSKLLKEEAHHLLPYSIIPKGVASAVVRFWFDVAPSRKRYATGVFASGHADNFFWLDLLQPPYQDWHDKTGGSVIECHLYGRRAEHAMEHTDDEVLERVRRVVQESWPGLEGHEVHAHLLRNPPTHTVFAPGVMSNLPAMQTQLRNMCLAGDWIQAPFPCLYLERATVTGMVAAQYAAQQAGYDASLLPTPIPPKPPTPSVRLGRKLARILRSSLPFRNLSQL